MPERTQKFNNQGSNSWQAKTLRSDQMKAEIHGAVKAEQRYKVDKGNGKTHSRNDGRTENPCARNFK
jgi:hypothetical protein